MAFKSPRVSARSLRLRGELLRGSANIMREATEEMKLIEGEDFYWEGAAFVFTERYHLRRGHCCENGCRHCPYGTKQEELRLVDAITSTTDEKSV